jgi:hypothetical protein
MKIIGTHPLDRSHQDIGSSVGLDHLPTNGVGNSTAMASEVFIIFHACTDRFMFIRRCYDRMAAAAT